MGISARDKVLQELNVNKESELLEFLMGKKVLGSRTAIKGLLRRNQILVNGKIISQFDHKLVPNDQVSIMEYDQSKKERKLLGIKIIFEDEYLIVVEKNANFLSVATPREKNKTVLAVANAYLQKQYGDNSRAFMLQRMDREMSGLMLIAKDINTQNAFKRNSDLLIQESTSVAIIEGALTPETGTVTSWLTENKNYEVFSSSFDNGGHKAITHYRTIRKTDSYSLVEFELDTSGKNQVRAQMEQKQTPILGDKKYGAKSSPIKRVALHANYIKIKHPVTGNIHEFISPLPHAMENFISSKYTI